MNATLFAPLLAGTVLMAGCGGPKTPLTQEQFVEVQANCNLGGATLGAANTKQTETATNPDGSTYTITTEFEPGSDETTIMLPSGMGEADIARAIACLSGEFDRLGAEARLQPAGDFSL
jgi:hypothetical protein